MGSKHEIRTGPSAGFQFCWLPVRPVDRSGFAHSREMVGSPAKTAVYQEQGKLHRQAIYVLDRPTYSNRETGLVRVPSHEAHTVAYEVTLACARDSRKDHPVAQVSPSTSRLVVK